jgi:ParB family transcriptional regulator, chromosome partitioning protein
MNPATATPKPKAARPKARKAQAPDVTPIAGGDSPVALECAIGLIEPHPDNPRKSFDQQALMKLSDSIARNGVLQPVLIRKHPDLYKGGPTYQLVCGERRYRAAKLAAKETIPAIFRDLSDAEALELMIVENEDREDLNPIELAIGLAALTKPIPAGGAGLTHKDAAARFGHEEAWATNLMRLLQLPESMQHRVASGEIPQTFARAMLPYVKSSVVVAYVEESIEKSGLEGMTRDDFEDLLDDAVQETTRPMDPKDKPYSDYRVNGYKEFGRLFKVTKENEAQLNVCELPVRMGRWGRGERKVVKRATNVQRWEELQEAAKKERMDARANGKGKSKADAGENGKAKAPTAAELKQRREDQDKQLGRRVEEWAQDLMRVAIARELDPGDWPARWLCRYYHGCMAGAAHHSTMQRGMEATGGKSFLRDWEETEQWLNPDDDAITRMDELDAAEAKLILDPDADIRIMLYPEVVWGMAGLVDVKLADEWKAASGDRLRRFFDLHTLDQLRDLVTELGDVVTISKKGELVTYLAERHETRPLAMPAVLRAAAPSKRGRKPR